MAVLAGCSCVGTGFFIGIQVGVYFPFIVAELGGSSQGAWIPNIFELGAAGLAGIVGRVSDVTGRRWILIGGFIMSAIGCIVIATAESTPVVLVGSAVRQNQSRPVLILASSSRDSSLTKASSSLSHLRCCPSRIVVRAQP